MITRRVDNIPANSFGSLLDGLNSQLDELKTSLQLVGTSSIIYKQNDTGATADWTGTLTHGGGGQPYYNNYVISATAATQGALLADLVYKVWINGVLTPHLPTGVFSLTNEYILPKAGSITNTQQWFLTIIGNGTATVALKAYVLATDAVTITVTEL
jgi:hypothetical protein